MNTQSTLSAIGAATLGICGMIAEMPSQLENQIPQVFPESQRGWIGLVLMIAAYAAHHYSASARTPSIAQAQAVLAQTATTNPSPFSGQQPKV